VAWLGLAPVLPAITDDEASLDLLLDAWPARACATCSRTSSSCARPTKEKFLRWLAADFPAYLEAYQRAYAQRVYFGGRYRDDHRRPRARSAPEARLLDEVERDRDFAEPKQIALF
jgi:hypothetical protein